MDVFTACVPNNYTKTALSVTNYQIALSNTKDFKGDDRMESSLLTEQNEQSEICMENSK